MGWDISTDDRGFITGATKSGKTYFARALLYPAPRLVVIDPKGLLFKRHEWNLQTRAEAWSALRAGKPARVWLPDPLSNEGWESYFEDIYALRNVVVYIDELFGVGPLANSKGLRALYTRGREYGIGVWGVSQRPRWIPLYTMSEVEYRVIFTLNILDDRKYMAETVGPIALQRLDKKRHQFILADDNHAVLYRNGLTVIEAPRLKPK